MFPMLKLINVRWQNSRGTYDPQNPECRDRAFPVSMTRHTSIPEACYSIMQRFYGGTQEATETRVFDEESSLEIHNPGTTVFKASRPIQFIRGNSDEMRTLATKFEQKLPIYKELSGIIVTATAFNAAINTEPRKIHERLADLELAERDLAIWKNMGHGLPDDQRQCYKPVRPIAVYALQSMGGNVDDALYVLSIAEQILQDRAR